MLLVARAELGELVLDAAHLAQPQDRAPADDLPLGFDDAVRQGRDRHREADAAGAQRIDRALHVARFVGLEPGAEGEHPVGRIGAGDQAGVTDDLGVVGRRRPGNEDLRLRQQQRIGAVDRRPRRDALVARGGLRVAEALARAHQQDGGDDREAQNPQRERERDELVPVELQEGRDIGVDRGAVADRGVLGARRRERNRATEDGGNSRAGRAESA